MMIKRGEIYYADLSGSIGSEQDGIRPVLIIQNDIGNKFSSTIIASCITSQPKDKKQKTHVHIKNCDICLCKKNESTIMLEQVRTLDKSRLREKCGKLDEETMELVDNAILVSIGLEKYIS